MSDVDLNILFFYANSADAYMDLEREHRNLQRLADAGNHRLTVLPAAEVADLRGALAAGAPADRFDVLHFSGHVTTEDGLKLRGEGRTFDYLDGEDFRAVLRNTGIKLVLLNACSSARLAESLLDIVPTVIGAQNRVRDVVARQFTRNFYSALNAGSAARTAFDSAIGKGRQGLPAYAFAGADDPFAARSGPALVAMR